MKTTNSPEDRKRKLTEIAMYRENEAAYRLVLCAVIAELVYVIQILGNMEINFLVGAVTMINIAMLFSLFTVAIKVNVYSDLFTKIGYILVGYLALRLFVLLPSLVKPTGNKTVIYGATIATLVFLLLGSLVSSQRIIMRNTAIKLAKEGKAK